MNQKQYHSLEELPLMMNMTDVAAALGISRAGAYKLAHSADFPAFQIANGLSFHARNSSIGWIGRVRNKNAREKRLDLLFGCACGNRVC